TNQPYEKKFLSIRYTHTGLENSVYKYTRVNDSTGRVYSLNENGSEFMNYLTVQYHFDNHKIVNRWMFNVLTEYAVNYKFGPGSLSFLKSYIELGYKSMYAKNRYFRTRFFGGGFPFKKMVPGQMELN